jgi:hypothetical protein
MLQKREDLGKIRFRGLSQGVSFSASQPLGVAKNELEKMKVVLLPHFLPQSLQPTRIGEGIEEGGFPAFL